MSSVRPLDPDSLSAIGPDSRLLIAGDAGDLPTIKRILAALPSDASGTVFVEVFGALQRTTLRGPDGVGVVWLARDVRRSDERAGAGAAKGEALVRALTAWIDEWLLADEHGDYVLWVGCAANVRINRFCDELDLLIYERDHRIAERRIRER